MTKDLERDLGFFGVVAISIGAMVGSGIFILPGLAYDLAGSGVVLAYLLAGVLVLPAALAKSEMATAMPEAGGTYLYIERSMGPLLGTIAGVGTWFSLSFKGALALIGGAPYLAYLVEVPIKPVALVLGVLLIVVNLVGVRQTGRMQIGIVAAMLLALVWFVVGGMPAVELGNFDGVVGGDGGLGVVAASGFVFVSYAGVTKIASVAEEVENPGRTIPLGILVSLVFTTALYVLIVFVIVGVLPGDLLAGSEVSVALVAERVLGNAGLVVVVVAALLALVSTANAGILSSSRYPFAMSRDGLAPDLFEDVHERFRTPANAITLTGGIVLVLVAVVPIGDIAKLASAFQIIVFGMVNVALIAFRESDADWYDPSFISPLYPWMQIFGALGSVLLLSQMGLVPAVGAVVIVIVSVLWYYLYAHGSVDREGAATDAARQMVADRAEAEAETTVADTDEYEVLVALTDEAGREHERVLLEIASDVARQRDGRVSVVWFEEVPDQVTLSDASETQTPAEIEFEEQTEALSAAFDVPIEYGEIVSHDTMHSIANYANHDNADAIVLDRGIDSILSRMVTSSTDWLLRHAPCDVIIVEDRGLDDLEEIAIVTDRGPYDPVKLLVAEALAEATGASVRLLYAIDSDPPAKQRTLLADHLDYLEGLLNVPTTSQLVETNDRARDLAAAAEGADLLVVTAPEHGLAGLVLTDETDRIVDSVDCTTLLVRSHDFQQPGLFRRAIERWLF